MERFLLRLTVANHCGVLNRITGVYAKQKYNIDLLAVRETGDPALSSVEIVSAGDPAAQRQLIRHLSKLFDVRSVALSDDFTL